MTANAPRARRLLRLGSWPERQVIADALRQETVGGVMLLIGAALALLWANSPWRHGYADLRSLAFGPSALHLHLDLGQWSADGLLAIFFFIAGLELKRELLVGDLRDPARAVLPVLAALAGVATPALVFLAVTAGHHDLSRGWAVPTATDIAFALAVLAVLGSHLPSALRSFLLTLAVVDDLVAITIIALFYTGDLRVWALLGALGPLAVFGWLARRRRAPWLLLAPFAAATWVLMHTSGVHATVAGVLLALTVPVHRRGDERRSRAERVEHRLRPLSAGFVVPVFAFFAAGVSLVGGGLDAALHDRVTIAVMLALIVGKMVGIFGSTWLVSRFTRAELDDGLSWGDVFGLSLLGGIGFTVSLLIGELAFGSGSPRDDHVKAAVLAGSVLSALLAAVVLRRREAVYRRLHDLQNADADGDGIPDVHQRPGLPGRAT